MKKKVVLKKIGADKDYRGSTIYKARISVNGISYSKFITKLNHIGTTILPITSKNKIILIKEFKVPFMKYFWQGITGSCKKNSDPLENAKDELAEEAGYKAKKWSKIAEYNPTYGLINQTCITYIAEDLKHVGQNRENTEVIADMKEFSIKEAFEMIKKKQITHEGTILAIYYLDNKLKR